MSCLIKRYVKVIKDLINIVDKSKNELSMSQQKIANLSGELLKLREETKREALMIN